MKKALIILAAALLAVSAFAQKDAIAPGYDMFKTVSGGETYSSFANNPIPAGFFFEGSEAFTGRIDYVGVPLATQPVNALNGIDTIIERLDTAVFNDQGTAVSGLRIKALSMAAAAPIEVSGTLWDVSVSLTEKQPVTEVVYVRDTDITGRFTADLVVNVRLTFTHQVNKKLTRTLDRTVHFNSYNEIPYQLAEPQSDAAAKVRAQVDQVMVDADGDGVADAPLGLGDNGFGMLATVQATLTEEPLAIMHEGYDHVHIVCVCQ